MYKDKSIVGNSLWRQSIKKNTRYMEVATARGGYPPRTHAPKRKAWEWKRSRVRLELRLLITWHYSAGAVFSKPSGGTPWHSTKTF